MLRRIEKVESQIDQNAMAANLAAVTAAHLAQLENGRKDTVAMGGSQEK